MNRVAILLLPISAIAISSCDQNQLSRSKAEQMIKGSPQARSFQTSIPFHRGGFQQGQDQGIWRVEDKAVILAEKATASIAGVSGDQYLYFTQTAAASITPKEPATISISVTGITDSPGAKNVKFAQFTWQYEALPSLVKRFAVKGGNGSAVLQLYDDGWRIAQVTMAPSEEPAPLSAEEIKAVGEDEAAESSRRAELAKAASIAANKLAARIQESRSPTRVIRTFIHKCNSGAPMRVVVTDVNVTGYNRGCTNNQEPDGSPKKPYTIWFGQVMEITTFSLQVTFELRGGRSSFWMYDESDRDALAQEATKALADWHSRFPDL